ncbi:hypothetical protein [Novosphingobium sp. MMS21-SN21R]|uniref:hypothetical protein n=1 Tax=Novosphingobium sp. MMS21-SN21R TaxID=2969298 RepID=UPI002887CB88|nr:hypothetical protein [Novosphingobium sp. MMS21-SN21R]MDT0507520.1 hypothetical protein [Novosphingobium sp. MMS21-SN21R]
MKIVLPYPDRLLWPNGRGHYHAKGRQVTKHRGWAMAATWEQTRGNKPTTPESRVKVKLTVSAKPRGPLPDKDNCSAAAKSYLDGIADALGINDRLFDAPVVEFDAARTSQFILEVTL